MTAFLRYLFYPNPGQAAYSEPWVIAVFVGCLLLILASFGVRYWRKGLTNPITRKLSNSWATAALSFGIVGVVLMVCRVERIQFLAMRFVWVLWVLALAAYALLQLKLFRSKHYEVLPTERFDDPRQKYLPGKKKH